jgi:transposase
MTKERKIYSRIGMDEKSVGKGHSDMTLVCDLGASMGEFTSEDRKQTSLDDYFEGLSREQREGIEAVVMDICDPYIASMKAHLPQAEENVVFDRYHLMTHMGKVVEKAQKQEHWSLWGQRDETLSG